MKIAAYCRVSTEKEAQIDSLEKQIEFFNEFTQKNGYELYKLYADEGISGKQIKNRKQFQQMMKDAKAKKFERVVVKDVSRFARNTKDLLELIEILEAKKVSFISKKEAIDTTTPTGKFMLTVFGAMAELERAYILDRQKEGIEAMPMVNGKKVSLKTGRPTGRPNAEFPPNFKIEYEKWKAKEQNANTTMEKLGLKRTTFYKLVKQYEESNSKGIS